MRYEKIKKSKKKIGQGVMTIIVLIILLCFLYSMIQLLIEPSEMFIIENGKIYEEEPAIGYIIRDEKIIAGENYKNGIVTIKNEGDRVSKGDSVFRYSTQDEEKLEEKIEELDN